MLESWPHPEQGYRARISVLRRRGITAPIGSKAACDRGLNIGARFYALIQSILDHCLNRCPPPRRAR